MPAHPGPYFINWGPASGPLRYRDAGMALGVLAEPDKPMPIGIAHPVGWMADPGRLC
jgi:hypothetical protein